MNDSSSPAALLLYQRVPRVSDTVFLSDSLHGSCSLYLLTGSDTYRPSTLPPCHVRSNPSLIELGPSHANPSMWCGHPSHHCFPCYDSLSWTRAASCPSTPLASALPSRRSPVTVCLSFTCSLYMNSFPCRWSSIWSVSIHHVSSPLLCDKLIGRCPMLSFSPLNHSIAQ